MNVAIGHSEDLDSKDAIDEALDACADRLGDRIPQAGLLYAAIDHDFPLILDRVAARYPGLDLIGCTTDGELSSTGGFAEDSLALMLFHSETVRFGIGLGEDVRADPAAASRRAVAQASKGLDAPVRLCITNPAGLGVDLATILATLSEALDGDVPVCGGLAGDQERFERTYQFFRGTVHTDAIPVLLFAGPLQVSTGVNSGWTPLGAWHRVTRAEGSVVYTINDQPAADFWKRYWGDLNFSPSHMFAVFPDKKPENHRENPPVESAYGQENYYMCTPAGFREDKSMLVLNPIPSGAFVRFADATRNQVVAGAASSVAQARAGYPGDRPDAALIFSCAGRRSLLGTRITEESRVLREELGEGLSWIGFYTYGELCPFPDAPAQHSHNSTFVTILIGES
ncbi:FIST signal transduction protein [Rhodocaloribacter sp.]